MKTKIAVLALIAVTAGVFTYKSTLNTPPSDLRDAVTDSESQEFNTAIPELSKSDVDVPAPKAQKDMDIVGPLTIRVIPKLATLADLGIGFTLGMRFVILQDADVTMLVDDDRGIVDGIRADNFVLIRTPQSPHKTKLNINGVIVEIENRGIGVGGVAAMAYYLHKFAKGEYTLTPFGDDTRGEKITRMGKNKFKVEMGPHQY